MQALVLDPIAMDAVHIRVYTHMYGPSHPEMHTSIWIEMFTLGTLFQFNPHPFHAMDLYVHMSVLCTQTNNCASVLCEQHS